MINVIHLGSWAARLCRGRLNSAILEKKMKIGLLLILLVLTILTMNSCETTYGIANIGSESKYLPKPVYKDTTEKATYLTGQFYHNLGDGYQPNELSYFGDVMINRS